MFLFEDTFCNKLLSAPYVPESEWRAIYFREEMILLHQFHLRFWSPGLFRQTFLKHFLNKLLGNRVCAPDTKYATYFFLNDSNNIFYKLLLKYFDRSTLSKALAYTHLLFMKQWYLQLIPNPILSISYHQCCFTR